METEVRSNLPDLPSTTDIARLAKSPTALLNHLSNVSPDDVSARERSDLADIWDQVGQTHEIDDHSHELRPVNDSLRPPGPPSATDPSVDANLN
jgi:hypothetical protein